MDAYCSAKVLSALTGGNLALFFDGLRAGDRTLQAAWDEYLAHLAVAVNNLRMIFDCDVIVGGYVGGFLSEFGAPLRELLAYLIREFTRDRKNRGVSAYADVNAYE